MGSEMCIRDRKKLDGALKDVQKLQTRINVLGRTLEKGAENLEEEN